MPVVKTGTGYVDFIEVTEQSGTALTDYQIKIDIDSTWDGWNYIASDGSDIYIKDNNGNDVPFWIETFDSTNKVATIWAKVPSIPANGRVLLYMFFGDGVARNLSDPANVFDFWDDFETWSGWTTYGSGVVSQSSDYVYQGSYSLKKDTNGDPNGGYKALGFTLDYPFVMEAWIYRYSKPGANADRLGVIDDSGNGYGPIYDHGTPNLRMDKRTNYSATTYNSVSIVDIYQAWYFMRFIWNNGTMTAQVIKSDGTVAATTHLTDSSYTSFTRVYVFGGYTYYVDNLRIRKYTDPEPLVTFSANETYQYLKRYKVTIAEQSGTDLTDFQVKIVLDSTWSGWDVTSSDGSEIRVYDSTETEYIPFWIEKWDTTNKEGIIWIKVPSISANGTVTVYLYAGSEIINYSFSDGDSVFELFDDFDGTELDTSKWSTRVWQRYTTYSGTTSVSVANSVLTLTTETSGSAGYALILDSVKTFNVPVTIGFKISTPNWGGTGTAGYYRSVQFGLMKFTSTSGNALSFDEYADFRVSEGGRKLNGYGTAGDDITGLDPTQMFTIDIKFLSNSASCSINDDEFTQTITGTEVSYTDIPVEVFLNSWSSGYTSEADIDWIYVRKYASTDPNVSVTESPVIHTYKLTFTEQSGTDLTDFQAKFSLDSTWTGWDYVLSDGSNFNVRDANNNNIPFWFEEWDYVNKSAVIWVKLPSLLANSSTDVYIDVGIGVSGTSDASAVFDLWDDFDGTSGLTWNAPGLTVTYDNADSYVKMVMLDNANQQFYTGFSAYTDNIIVEASLKVAAAGSYTDFGVGIFGSEPNENTHPYYLFFAAHKYAGTITIGYTDSSGTTSTLASSSYTFSFGNWTNFGIHKSGTGTAGYLDYVSKLTGTLSETFNASYVGLALDLDTGDTLLMDWIRVRKYASSEPTYSITEVTGQAYTQDVLDSISQSDVYVYLGVKSLIDSITQSEVIGKDVDMNYYESIAAISNYINGIQLLRQDVLSLSDNINMKLVLLYYISESVVLTELIRKLSILKENDDYQTVNDENILEIIKGVIEEILNITEDFSELKIIAVKNGDVVSTSDVKFLFIQKMLSEAIDLIEELSKYGSIHLLADIISILELVQLNLLLDAVDDISIVDVTSLYQGISRLFSDIVSNNDKISKYVKMHLSVDNFAAGDSLFDVILKVLSELSKLDDFESNKLYIFLDNNIYSLTDVVEYWRGYINEILDANNLNDFVKLYVATKLAEIFSIFELYELYGQLQKYGFVNISDLDVVRGIGKTNIDDEKLDELLVKKSSLNYIDNSVLNDATARVAIKNIGDILSNVLDNVIFSISHFDSSDIVVADLNEIRFVKSVDLASSFNMQDSKELFVNTYLIEKIIIYERVKKYIALYNSLIDSLSVYEEIYREVKRMVNLTDSFVVDDIVSNLFFTIKLTIELLSSIIQKIRKYSSFVDDSELMMDTEFVTELNLYSGVVDTVEFYVKMQKIVDK